MMPGVTCLPRPSTSTAPAGADRLLPTAAILPPDDEQVRVLQDSGRTLRPDRRAAHDDGRTGAADRPRLRARETGERPSRGAAAGAGAVFFARLAASSRSSRACSGSIRDPSIQISATRGSSRRTARRSRRRGWRSSRPRGCPDGPARPSCRAGIVVTAASASSRDSPRAIASRTRFGNVSRSSEPVRRERKREAGVPEPLRVRRSRGRTPAAAGHGHVQPLRPRSSSFSGCGKSTRRTRSGWAATTSALSRYSSFPPT